MGEVNSKSNRFWSLVKQPGTIFLVAGLFILLPLLLHAWLGIFSRYTADDFCLAWNGTTRSFRDAQLIWYKTDSSRYAATLVFTLSDRLGRWTVQALPALVLILWLVGGTWLVDRIQKKLSLGLPLAACFFFAALWEYFVLLLAPNLYQVLYWRSGMVVYLLPLVMLQFLAILLLYNLYSSRYNLLPLVAVLSILLFFLNGGFSETMAVIQISMLLLALLVILVLGRGQVRGWGSTLLASALLGSLLALAAMYFAPATQMRRGLLGTAPGLFSLVRMSLKNAFLYIYITLGEKAFPLLILLVTAILAGYLLFSKTGARRFSPTSLVTALLLAPLVAYLWVVCVVAPFAYGESTYPEARVLIDATYILVPMIMVEGLILGAALGNLHLLVNEPLPFWLNLVAVIAILGLSIFPLYSTRKAWSEMPTLQQRAQAWDVRDARIHQLAAGGQEDITVDAFTSYAGLLEVGPSPSNWVNGCAALYYHIHSITAQTP